METPAAQFDRILSALEDLAEQEELLLSADDYRAIPALHTRAAPLVEFLAATADAGDRPLRQRVAAVIARRARSEQKLDQMLGRVREELRQIQTSRQRIAKVAPAYRQPAEPVAPTQLSARG